MTFRVGEVYKCRGGLGLGYDIHVIIIKKDYSTGRVAVIQYTEPGLFVNIDCVATHSYVIPDVGVPVWTIEADGNYRYNSEYDLITRVPQPDVARLYATREILHQNGGGTV